MNQYELENWRKVKLALEASGKTSSPIYIRACEVLRKYSGATREREVLE